MNTLQDFSWVFSKINTDNCDLDDIILTNEIAKEFWGENNFKFRDSLFIDTLNSFEKKPINYLLLCLIKN